MKLSIGLALIIGIINMFGINNKNKATSNSESDMLIDKISKAERDEAVMYYAKKALKGRTAIEVLENSEDEMLKMFEQISEEAIYKSYAYGKWTVGEVLVHVITYEKITQERLLEAIGKAKHPLKYVCYDQTTTVAGAKKMNKSQVLSLFKSTREKTIDIFKNMTEEEKLAIGSQDGFRMSSRVMALCASGHQQHHFSVLKERYHI